MCPHAELLLGRPDARRPRGADGDDRDRGRPADVVRWRELVLALGAVPRTVPVPGLARARALVQVAAGRDQPPQPRAARASRRPTPRWTRQRARAQLSFVFVGAGYAGVEALAELSDLVDDAMRYYPRLRDVPRRWVLVDAAPKILPEIPPRLGEYAARELERARRRDPRRHDARVGDARTRPCSATARASRPTRSSGRRACVRTRSCASSGCRSTTAAASRSTSSCACAGHAASGRSATARACRTRAARRPTRRRASTRSARRAGSRRTSSGEPEAVRLPDARPGRDTRPLQGNRRRARPPPPRLPRLVRHALVPPLPAAARAAEHARRRRLDGLAPLPARPRRARDARADRRPRQPSGATFSALSIRCFVVSTPANRSPCLRIRSSTTSIVNADGIELLVHLVPAKRRRHRGARPRPHRVGRRDRLPLAVLVRVDQHAAPLRLRPLRRREPAMRARDRAGDDLRELARVVERVAALDRHEHVHAVGARRLRERRRGRARRAPP